MHMQVKDHIQTINLAPIDTYFMLKLLQQHVWAGVLASSAQLTLSLRRGGTLAFWSMLLCYALDIHATHCCMKKLFCSFVSSFLLFFCQCCVGAQRGSFLGLLAVLRPFCSACGGYRSVRVHLAGFLRKGRCKQ